MLIQSQRAVCFLLILLQLSCFDAAPGISFHEPQPGQTVSGRTFTISVGVSDFAFPSDGKGVLYLDGGKLIEVRQPQLTISMDGIIIPTFYVHEVGYLHVASCVQGLEGCTKGSTL